MQKAKQEVSLNFRYPLWESSSEAKKEKKETGLYREKPDNWGLEREGKGKKRERELIKSWAPRPTLRNSWP